MLWYFFPEAVCSSQNSTEGQVRAFITEFLIMQRKEKTSSDKIELWNDLKDNVIKEQLQHRHS